MKLEKRLQEPVLPGCDRFADRVELAHGGGRVTSIYEHARARYGNERRAIALVARERDGGIFDMSAIQERVDGNDVTRSWTFGAMEDAVHVLGGHDG